MTSEICLKFQFGLSTLEPVKRIKESTHRKYKQLAAPYRVTIQAGTLNYDTYTHSYSHYILACSYVFFTCNEIPIGAYSLFVSVRREVICRWGWKNCSTQNPQHKELLITLVVLIQSQTAFTCEELFRSTLKIVVLSYLAESILVLSSRR